ncbi:MAG: hypothetical protein AAF654_15335, partial [Myxococcota bacterium]
MCKRFWVAGLAFSAVWTADANALVIDDFSVGATEIEVDGNVQGVTRVQLGLDTAGVLGGAREITVSAPGGDATFVVDANAQQAFFPLGTKTSVDVTLSYPFEPPADLRGSGGVLALEVSGISSPISTGIYFMRMATGARGGVVTFDEQLLALSSTEPRSGVIEIPLTDFTGVDFSEVTEVAVVMRDLPGSLTIAFDGIFVTPEPSSLLAAGVASITLL